MKLVFFGTDDFSVIVLEELKKTGLAPELVITAPDKPRGRGLHSSPSIVSMWAREHKVAVSHEYPSDGDLFVVASYGKIIPKNILDLPKYGALNVHPSLLPKYRGPSPIESQILADEKEIGVTIMQMDEKMDHGPIVAARQLESTKHKIQNSNKTQETNIFKGSELRKILAKEGGKLLAETIPKWVAGKIKPVPQDESKATYTRKFNKEDGLIDFADDPYKNFLKICAFNGGVGTYFFWPVSTPSLRQESEYSPLNKGEMKPRRIRVKVIDAKYENEKLEILRVIPEGKKEMSYADFLRGVRN
jgi:methionyl-tRNA formyltransferase